MIYADYDCYVNEYFGSTIQNDDFQRLAACASRYLDYITQGRAERNAGLEAVRLACCALAEQYQAIDAAQAFVVQSLSAGNGGAEVQSETVGGWSKSYRAGGDSAQAAAQSADAAQTVLPKIAQQYLAHTGLLYRGRRCGK